MSQHQRRWQTWLQSVLVGGQRLADIATRHVRGSTSCGWYRGDLEACFVRGHPLAQLWGVSRAWLPGGAAWTARLACGRLVGD